MKNVTISVIGEAKVKDYAHRKDIFFISLEDMDSLQQNTLSFSILEKRQELPLVVSAVVEAFNYANIKHVFIATKEALAGDLFVELKETLHGRNIRVEHVSPYRLRNKHQLGVMSLGVIKSYAMKIIEAEYNSSCEETRARNTALVARLQIIYDKVRLPMNFGDNLWAMPEA